METILTASQFRDLDSDEQLFYLNNLSRKERAKLDAELEAKPQRAVLPFSEQLALATEFLKKFPQFRIDIPENVRALDSTIASQYNDATGTPTLAEVVSVFEELAKSGRLVLDGTKCGLDSDCITGWDLAHHSELWRLLSPVTKKSAERIEEERIRNLSADQFKAEQLQETSLPWLVKRSAEQAYNTFVASNPTYVNSDANLNKIGAYIDEHKMVVSVQNITTAFHALKNELELRPDVKLTAGQTTFTDYAVQTRGQDPIYADRYSFRKLVESLSPEELMERCQHDRKFENAVNAMGN